MSIPSPSVLNSRSSGMLPCDTVLNLNPSLGHHRLQQAGIIVVDAVDPRADRVVAKIPTMQMERVIDRVILG
jgi:hypothetical protein